MEELDLEGAPLPPKDAANSPMRAPRGKLVAVLTPIALILLVILIYLNIPSQASSSERIRLIESSIPVQKELLFNVTARLNVLEISTAASQLITDKGILSLWMKSLDEKSYASLKKWDAKNRDVYAACSDDFVRRFITDTHPATGDPGHGAFLITELIQGSIVFTSQGEVKCYPKSLDYGQKNVTCMELCKHSDESEALRDTQPNSTS